MSNEWTRETYLQTPKWGSIQPNTANNSYSSLCFINASGVLDKYLKYHDNSSILQSKFEAND
jgi:hypothetical protein